MRKNKFYLLFTLCLLVCICNVHVYAQEEQQLDPYLNKAEDLKFENPDSSAVLYRKSVDYLLEEKDTIGAINSLRLLAFLHAHNVNYSDSYDNYWDALILADSSKDSISMAAIYEDLGWLYSFYDRDQEALKYFNMALSLNKELIEDIDPQAVVSNYYALAVFNRKIKNFDLVIKYLDSCAITRKEHSIPDTNFFTSVEMGFVEGLTNDFDGGLEKLNAGRDFFQKNNPSYLMVIDYLIAEVYRKKGNFKESEKHFLLALNNGEVYNAHTNYFPKVYQGMSQLYAENGQFGKAYRSLKDAKKLNDEIFGANSMNNRQLFLIKDEYRLEKERQVELLHERKLEQLEQNQRISNLKTILWISSVLFLVIVGFLLVRNLKVRHKVEKKVLSEKNELEHRKHLEILEIKNKELASSALQLVEKEQFLQNLKKKLSQQEGQIDVKNINRMIRAVQGNTSNNWREFEARFTEINQSFYNNLKAKFPKLSQTDQKICALIKLNFSSKEMASLLAISVESVHTSRYRLRKKLRLSREESLSEFIDNV